MRNPDEVREKRFALASPGMILALTSSFYIIFILRTSFLIKGNLYFTLIDDAMISMRYARNLAQGYGLVWNPGQAPIEGFTNLGWVLWMMVLHLFPIPQEKISLGVMLTSGVILLINIFVVFQIGRLLAPASRYAPAIAGTMVAFYFPLVFWSLRGMEVGALTLMISLAILFSLRLTLQAENKVIPWLALSLIAALIIRMDSFIQVGLILLYLIGKRTLKFQTFAVLALSAGLTLLAVIVFQKSYFGDFLPNTYYLKVNGVSAIERIKTGLLVFNNYALGDFMMLLGFSLLGMALFKNIRTPEFTLLLGLFAAQSAYSIWVGGDYAEELVNSANRFITQGMPALIILFSLVVDRFIDAAGFETPPVRFKQGFLPLAIAIGLGAVMVISGKQWVNWYIDNAPMLKTDILRVKLGLHIRKYTSPEAVIAVHAAGQIPYYSERTTIDLLGKSDAVIAKGPLATAFAPGHDKWNYEYSILQLKPDLVADRFGQLTSFMSGVKEYQLLPNGIYIRTGSKLFNPAGLSQDYKSP
ncbi:MAG: hypothetical protein HYX49_10790 [Chloroflexi bacterium]|nr:hypothetical protein [Chloroflexota bacterium]